MEIRWMDSSVFRRAVLTAILVIAILLSLRALQVLTFTLRWPQSLTPDAALQHFDAGNILQGKAAYREMYSLNLPVTHAIHAFGIKVFGADDVGMRLLNVLWLGITCAVTFFYLKRLSRTAALISIPMTLLLTVDVGTFGQLQREMLLLPFWTVLLWISDSAANGRARARQRWFWFGLVSGFAAFIKPQSLLLSVLLIGYWFFAKQRSGERQPVWTGLGVPALFLAGGTVIAAAVPLLFGYEPGYLFHWYKYFRMYSGNSNTSAAFMLALAVQPFSLWPSDFLLSFGEPAFRGGRIVVGTFTLFHVFSAGLYVYLCRRAKEAVPVLTLLVAGYLSYLLHRRGFAYHLIGMWHGFNLCLAVAIGKLTANRKAELDTWKTKIRFYGPYVSALILVLLVWGRQVNAERTLRNAGFGHLLRPVRPPDFQVVDSIGQLAEGLRAKRGSPRVTIQVLEFHAIALTSVQRFGLESASSFMQADPLYIDYEGREASRRLFMEQLQRNPPDILVLEGSDPEEKLGGFPEFAAFVRANFEMQPRLREPYWLFLKR